MRLKHIEVFNAVMLTGSVGAAARLLHVSQPAVTQALQHAELHLGYALFTRQRQRLVATVEAQALYPEVQQLMAQLEAVRRIASALGRAETQELRLFIVPSLAVKALPDALRLFRRKHPQMNVSVRVQHSREIAHAVALQEGDVGIVYGSKAHPAVEEELIATGRLMCVSRADAAEADRRTTITLEEVLRGPFIRIDDRDPIGTMLAEQWSRLGGAPQAGITVQTHHIAMVLAEEGFGPAIIDSFTARAVRNDRLHVRTVLPEVAVEVRALMPQGVRSPKAVADFIKAMKTVTAASEEPA
ncbi:LysR family transcriptional regulator [Xylophilus rhododendri]|uniref:LysR family transcriptional regulator n=1 Tax=Xylophilus rhododendri TaxID=2697032 RepID=A0A857J6Q3_9BURK|nr:LysR family transcriptional regulator [Xylophilus rhododendri]QHI98711.1 LysR family transcriptional regulator [Xylophilus rhododendri]